jgi:hypothetical protein
MNAAALEITTTDARAKAKATYDTAKAEMDGLKPSRPMHPPPLTVPAQYRLRFYNDQGCAPAKEPATCKDPEAPIHILNARP